MVERIHAERIDVLPPDAEDDLRLRSALQALAGAARTGEPAPAPLLRGIGTRRRRVRVALSSAVAVAATVLVVGVAGGALLPGGSAPSPAARTTGVPVPSSSAPADNGALLPAAELPRAVPMPAWRVATPPADNSLQQCLPADASTLRWYVAGEGAHGVQTAVQNVAAYPGRQQAVDGFGDAVAWQRLCQSEIGSTRTLTVGDAAALTFGAVATPDAGLISQGWVTVLRGSTVSTIGFAMSAGGRLPNQAGIQAVAASLAARLPGPSGGPARDVVLSGLPAGPVEVPYGRQFGGSLDTGYLVNYLAGKDGLRLVLDRTMHLDERQYHRWAAANGAGSSDTDLGQGRREVNRNPVTRSFVLAADARIYLRGSSEPVGRAELEDRLRTEKAKGPLRLPVLLLHTDGGTDGDVVLFQEEIR